jgi:hypothetical protein
MQHVVAQQDSRCAKNPAESHSQLINDPAVLRNLPPLELDNDSAGRIQPDGYDTTQDPYGLINPSNLCY